MDTPETSITQGPPIPSKPRDPAGEAVAAWSKGRWPYFVTCSVLVVGLGLWSSLIASVALAGMFMAWQVGIVSALRTAGFANRWEVGLKASLLLIMAQMVGILVNGPFQPAMGLDYVSLVLILGAGICLLLAGIDQPQQFKNPKTVLNMVLLTAVVSMTASARQGQERITTREEALQYAEKGLLNYINPVQEYDHISRLLSIIPHLTTDGGQPPNPKALEEFCLEWSQRENDWYTWRDLVRNAPDLLTEQEFANAKDSYPLVPLPENGEGYYDPALDFMSLLDRERSGPLTDTEVHHLAERALQKLPEPAANLVLKELYMRWAILNHLNDQTAIERLAPAVKRSLLATWTGPQNEMEAGFSATDFSDDAGNPLERSSIGYMEDTDFAIRLMAQFGVPESLELDKLHAYLVRFSTRRGSTVEAWYAYTTALRSRLESLPAWKAHHPPGFDRFLLPGFILTAIVLALFNIVVTLQAPSSNTESPTLYPA